MIEITQNKTRQQIKEVLRISLEAANIDYREVNNGWLKIDNCTVEHTTFSKGYSARFKCGKGRKNEIRVYQGQNLIIEIGKKNITLPENSFIEYTDKALVIHI